MDIPINKPNLSIPEFFNNKSVLITGGTGFLGKLITEKLLRSCPGIDNIYLLCRSKKGKNVNERLEEIISSSAFDLIRDQNPEALNKIILIEGDVAMLELGISKTDQEILKDKVSVVLHSAATINFNEPLSIAINTNLRSMRELIELGKEMKNLKSFVHISTAYTNWFDINVEEVIKPTEISPHRMLKMMSMIPTEAANQLVPSILGKHVNTYTFTKALAENLLLSDAKDLPVAIVRPSMVGASMIEPQIGYIDNMAAVSIYIYMMAKGLFRASLVADKFGPCELIPADLVTNMVIATAWKTALDKTKCSTASFPKVYHIAAGATNPLQWKELTDWSVLYGRRHPLESVSWYPQHRIYKSKLLFKADTILTHIIPAYLMDAASILMGVKPRAAKLQTSFYKNYCSALFVSGTPHKFQTSNYKIVQDSMNKNDQKIFNFDPMTISWRKYMENYYFGIKKFVLKEKSLSSASSVSRLRRLKFASYFLKLTTSSTGLFLLWKNAGRDVKELINSKFDKNMF